MRKMLAALVLAGFGGAARAQFCPGVTPWVFDDVQDSDPFCGVITWMATSNVTLGCQAIDANHRLYCPDAFVTRKQMAAFMKRQADAVMPLTCAAGQVMKWNGALWACADDNIGGSGGGGTVTSVLAGTGLQGSPNPIVGAGSLNLAPSYQLPQSCANGQVPKSNGAGGWTCGNDNAGAGTVTSVATGAGLTGGPITAAGTIAIAAGGVTAAMLAQSGCTSGQVLKWNGSAWACAADAAGTANGFVQGGNAFGAEAVLGTTDNNALDVRVNNARVMRYEPNAISPNVIGGSPANTVTAGVRGATIAGGGVATGATDPDFTAEAPNTVTDAYGAVGGGYANRAGDATGTSIDRPFATVGGGSNNTASGSSSTVGGGSQNTAVGFASAVGGGSVNNASGGYSTVGGGSANIASGFRSTVGGGVINEATGSHDAVGGGFNNTASGGDSTIGGGARNAASGQSSTVGGGHDNTASGQSSTVGGGQYNTASGFVSTVGGGEGNAASGNYSWAGGRRARTQTADATPVPHHGVFVWADGSDLDFRSTANNQFAVRATGGARFVTAVDGAGNPTRTVSIDATGQVTIPIETAAPNLALYQATSADYARLRMIRNGGTGTYWDIAAGSSADVLNFYRQGSGNVMSLTPGGADLLLMNNGARLTSAGVWTNVSDRNVKENFAPIDALDVLARIVALPVTKWNYKAEPGVKRIGPMAQDFHAAFGLGASDRTIGSIDADGVALAAIQGLNAKLEAQLAERDAQIRALRAEIAALRDVQADVAVLRAAVRELLGERDVRALPAGLSR